MTDDTQDPIGQAFYQLDSAISYAERVFVSDGDLPDFVGDLDRRIARLRDLRKRHFSEIDGPTAGHAYRAVTQRAAKRTYNTQAILAEATAEAGDLTGVIHDLIDSGAVRLQWQWLKLRDWLIRNNLPLHLVPREIEDGDPDAMVGEVWETKVRIEGIEQ